MLTHPAPAKLTNKTSRSKQKHLPNLTFGPIFTKLRNLPSTIPSNYKSLPTTKPAHSRCTIPEISIHPWAVMAGISNSVIASLVQRWQKEWEVFFILVSPYNGSYKGLQHQFITLSRGPTLNNSNNNKLTQQHIELIIIN